MELGSEVGQGGERERERRKGEGEERGRERREGVLTLAP